MMENAYIPRLLKALGLIVMLQSPLAAFNPSEIENLTPVSPLPLAVDLDVVVSHGTTVFAIGGQGHAAVSYNSGINWIKAPRVPSSSIDYFADLIYDGTRYIALRSGAALISTDLENWTVSSDFASHYGLAYGEGVYVACGSGTGGNEPIRTSIDADIWTNPTNFPAGIPTMRSIAYGGGAFVAGGDNGVILYSADGVNWSTVFDGVPGRSGSSNRFEFISYANNLFFATGSSALLYTSSDGINWTAQAPDTTHNFEEVTFIDGKYIFGNTLSSTFTTTDLVNFERVYFGASGTFNDYTHVGDTLIAVGRDGFIGTTTNGTTWTERRQRLGDDFKSLATGANLFVTIDSGTNAYYTSDDGLLWTLRFIGTDNPRTALVYGGGRFLALGNSKAAYSTDGINWTEASNGLDFLPDSLHFENGRFIVLGRSGELAESADGLSWTRHDTGSTEWLWDITYGEGVYVVTQNTNVLLTSSNLSSWTTVAPTADTSDPFLYVAYGDGRFIATSRSAPFAYSEDGLNWSVDSDTSGYFVNRFGYDTEYGFYIHGTETTSRQLVDSSDLSSWVTWNFPANSGLNGIAKLNGVVVGVGDNGVILSTAANAEGFNGWVLDNFPDENDGEIIGAYADPDKDGQSNLEEYARGTDPNTATPLLETVLTRTAFGTELTWTLPEYPEDVAVGAEYSQDLETWSDNGLLIIPTDNGNGTTSYLARVTGEAGTNTMVYIRVRWTQLN